MTCRPDAGIGTDNLPILGTTPPTLKESIPTMRTYVLDGRRITTIDDFYREIGEAVNGEGGWFGQNLDALADCLHGSFGTPPLGEYDVTWEHADLSRRALDFTERVRYDTALLESTPEHDKDRLRRRIARSERREGRTPFEEFLQVFGDVGVELRLE